MKKLIIHAPNINTGGGLVLLRGILKSSAKDMKAVQLDIRVKNKFDLSPKTRVNYIRRTMLARCIADFQLKNVCSTEDTVLCLNGLPPLCKLPGNTVVFVQNRFLVDKRTISLLQGFVRLRILIERSWLKFFTKNADHYVVQTESMAQLLQSYTNTDKKVSVIPFATDLDLNPVKKIEEKPAKFDFIYIASGDPQKNHQTLLDAWKLLAEMGYKPSLCLTIDSSKYSSLAEYVEKYTDKHNLKIKNVGWLSFELVKELYSDANAMIFPSLVESFGLPLFEAKKNKLPILAAELDYVRDLVNPDQSFDPTSSRSIARAVIRHLKINQSTYKILSPTEFLKEIL